jgi:YHS domain-containing protein
MKNIIILSIAIFLSSCAAKKQGSEINIRKVDGVENVAVKGIDVVSYFEKAKTGEVKPKKGLATNYVEINDVKWYFSSQKNLETFKSNPEKYMPQYGGYCAYGVSVPKQKIDIDPNAWKIHNGKLYLNYTRPTQDIWLQNIEDHIESANENWPEVKKQ